MKEDKRWSTVQERWGSMLRGCPGREPLPQEPVFRLFSHQEPVFRLFSHQEPVFRLSSHLEPVFRLSTFLALHHLTKSLQPTTLRQYTIGFIFFLACHLHIYTSFHDGPYFRSDAYTFILFYSLFFSFTGCWIIGLMRGKRLQQLQRNLKEMDELENQFPTGQRYRSSSLLLLPFMLFGVKCIIATAIRQEFYGFVKYVSYILLRAAIILLAAQYAALARRCAALNQNLTSRLLMASKSQLYLLAYSHQHLCHISQDVNKHYGPTLLITFYLLFVQATLTPFLIITRFNRLSGSVWRNMPLELFQTIMLAVIIVCASDHLEKQTAEFYETLKSRMLTKESLCNNYKLRIYLKVHPTVSMTACGYFHVGYSLFSSLVAGSISYLVILIQFAKMM